MKLHHHVTLRALKHSLIVIAAFTFYDMTEELEKILNHHFPDTAHLHDHYARVLHLVAIFAAEIAIGYLMYKLFNFLH
jgi:hypothetical protein